MEKACSAAATTHNSLLHGLIQGKVDIDIYKASKWISWEIIQANPDKPWNWWAISMNPNITLDIIQANPDNPWDWSCISMNPTITWEIIQGNPDKPWVWWSISKNPSITWDIIQANPDKPWDWWGISANPNITLEIIQTNPDKPWYWHNISGNPSIYKPDAKFKADFERRWRASDTIKRCWFRCITNPEYAMCRRRLLKEYSVLLS